MKQTPTYVRYYEKMVDYKLFAFILLSLGVFLYFGTIISLDRGVVYPKVELLLTTLMLAGSFLFFSLSIKYKLKANQDEQSQQ
ncbi:MAG: YrhC family protein [Bacillus sp. (in: firmicutes)]